MPSKWGVPQKKRKIVDRRPLLENPYRPGAGRAPPLAGPMDAQDFLRRSLRQGYATQNALIAGLSGSGKTVLLDHAMSLMSLRWVLGPQAKDRTALPARQRPIFMIGPNCFSRPGRAVPGSAKKPD